MTKNSVGRPVGYKVPQSDTRPHKVSCPRCGHCWYSAQKEPTRCSSCCARRMSTPRTLTLREKFEYGYVVVPSGCWIWVGARVSKGYGSIRTPTGVVGAHRLGYELYAGPIPAGVEPDHLCRERACVNWRHMELVDGYTNMMRGNNPAAINKRRTHCKYGHEFSEANTKLRAKKNRNGRVERVCRECLRS